MVPYIPHPRDCPFWGWPHPRAAAVTQFFPSYELYTVTTIHIQLHHCPPTRSKFTRDSSSRAVYRDLSLIHVRRSSPTHPNRGTPKNAAPASARNAQPRSTFTGSNNAPRLQCIPTLAFVHAICSYFLASLVGSLRMRLQCRHSKKRCTSV